MPPPMPNPQKRMTANPARPVGRYRPGKPVHEEESSDEEGSEEEEQQPQAQRKPQPRPVPVNQSAQRQEEQSEDEEGFVTDPEDEYEDEDREGGVAITTTAQTINSTHVSTTSRPSLPKNQSAVAKYEEESEDESEDESSEEESSSEEEQPQRKFQRPTFIKKSDRKSSVQPQNNGTTSTANTTSIQPSDSTEQDDTARRLAETEALIKAKIERDNLARAQGKKSWDDDEEVAPEDQVDDTDGLDPEAEHAAWKLRELRRLKRDRETIEAREKEIEELERRRNLTAEEREKEDREFLDKQKAEKEEGRGKASYLARYHHKGAFFQDDEAAEILKKRDLMGARFQDDIGDKSTLPEYMRIRDMTKLGKKGRTRYTDLRGEDTGRFGDEVKRWRGSGAGGGREGDNSGMDMRGVDERFLPDDDRRGGGRDGPTGANASAVGQRREQRRRSRSKSSSRSRSRSPRRRRDDTYRGDSYRSSRKRSYSRSPSRSRSPVRRKRSPSPYRDRDKRRRVDAT